MTETTNRRPVLEGCRSLLCERPPSLAPTRGWHMGVDRFLDLSRPLIWPIFLALGFLASITADQLSARAALLPAAVFFALVGGWCSLNFARCREAHCVVTGVGYGVLAVVAVVAFVLDQQWRGVLWLAALGVVVAGVVFEAAWVGWRGGKPVRRRLPLEQS